MIWDALTNGRKLGRPKTKSKSRQNLKLFTQNENIKCKSNGKS